MQVYVCQIMCNLAIESPANGYAGGNSTSSASSIPAGGADTDPSGSLSAVADEQPANATIESKHNAASREVAGR